MKKDTRVNKYNINKQNLYTKYLKTGNGNSKVSNCNYDYKFLEPQISKKSSKLILSNILVI